MEVRFCIMDEKLLEEALEILKRWTKEGPLKGIKLKKDNRIRANGKADLKTRIITLNFKRIDNINGLRLTLLHELGHFYHEKNKDECSEYLAHKWAMEIIRVFYNDSYDYAIESLRETIEYDKFKQKYPKHYKAFERIYGELPKQEDKTVIKPDSL